MIEEVTWLKSNGVQITKTVEVKAVYEICGREFYGYTEKPRKIDGLLLVTGVAHFRDKETGVEVLQVNEIDGQTIGKGVFEDMLRKKIVRWQNTKNGIGYQFRMASPLAVIDAYIVAKVSKIKFGRGC